MAAVDYFLKIEGIDGESFDSKHKGEIDIHSWSWGATQQGAHAAQGGGGAGKVSMQDFHFTMNVNKATPKLMLACASGEHIPKAVLTCRKAGKEQQEYLKVTLTDLLISSFQTGGRGRGAGRRGSQEQPEDGLSEMGRGPVHRPAAFREAAGGDVGDPVHLPRM